MVIAAITGIVVTMNTAVSEMTAVTGVTRATVATIGADTSGTILGTMRYTHRRSYTTGVKRHRESTYSFRSTIANRFRQSSTIGRDRAY